MTQKLFEENCFWMIEKGSVDLIVQDKESTKTLLTFEEGELFFPLAKDLKEYRFSTHPKEETTFKKIPPNELDESLLESWIRKFYEILVIVTHENIDFAIAIGKKESFTLEKESDIAPLFSSKTKNQ